MWVNIPKLDKLILVEADERDSYRATDKASIAIAFEGLGHTVVSIEHVVGFLGFYSVLTNMGKYPLCGVGFHSVER